MGSSLLQGIFATQDSNPGLLHGRLLFYQLSGIPGKPETFYRLLQILHSGVGGGEVNEHTYLHKFTTYLPKFVNKENEPIWIMQLWKLNTTKSSSNNCELLLSRFSRVWLCVTPQTAAHQAPPSLGVSRQGHWSRLPFPSPVNESEKWKWSRSVVSCSSPPHGRQPTRLLRPWDFPGKSTGWVAIDWTDWTELNLSFPNAPWHFYFKLFLY